jgi:LysR family glycine cleavage system transcriptional activator
MSRRFPPLNALRAFEAAGRRQSFTLAADELCVTPGAISRQIKGLEDLLGVPLFERHHREVRLTESSREYLRNLSRAFEIIESGTDQFRQISSEKSLNVYCSMTLTMRWLVPRLNRFHSAYPKRNLCIHTPIPQPDHLQRALASVAVRQGTGPWEGCEDISLLSTKLIPVCSTALLDEANGPLGLDLLRRATLLHSLARPDDWRHWAAANSLDLNVDRGIRFESSSLAYEAAINGMGIAMGQIAMVMSDLQSGRLVAPYNQIACDGTGIFLTVRPEFSNDPCFFEFRDWIIEETARYLAEEAQFCSGGGIKIGHAQ